MLCADCERYMDGSKEICACPTCGHVFHVECVQRKLAPNGTYRCPRCKRRLPRSELRPIFVDLPLGDEDVHEELFTVQKHVLLSSLRLIQDRVRADRSEELAAKLDGLIESSNQQLEERNAARIALEESKLARQAAAGEAAGCAENNTP